MTWPVVPLGAVANTALGKMLDKGKPKGHAHVPYLRNENVQWGRIDTHDILTMELADDERDRFEVREGDLLVCEGGEIGRCAIWHGRPEYLAYQKALHRIRPSDALENRYLRYLLEHHALSGNLATLSTGTTIAHLPQQQLRRVPVPLAPVEEQRRIVDLLEGHLSRLETSQSSIANNLKRLSSLRDATLAESVAQAKSDPRTETITLGEIARVGSGMTPLKGNKSFYDGGTVPWITSGDLHQGVINTATQFVTQHALDETSLKLVPAGALLIAMYGEGKTRGTAAELAIEATTNQACASVVLADSTLRPWVRLILDANYTALRRRAIGGVQPNLNLSLVRSIEVPLAPPDIRATILGRVAKVDEARVMLRGSLIAAQRRGSALRRSLLADAFSGRLAGSATEWPHAMDAAET
ncbi:MAG: EcoKI restriction-modification system protein HsdS [Marmoricola sp.]|nr:EcoKI restriction-modification system protein HsdS [Marmoricola sp.]